MEMTNLVKADFTEVRKAKITLQCELRPNCYTYDEENENKIPNLSAIAEALYDLDYDLLSPNGEAITTMTTVAPLGYSGPGHQTTFWLVLEIVESASRHDETEWKDFLAKVAAKILRILAVDEDNCLASIDYLDYHRSDKRFVIITDTGGHDESDYIVFD